MHMGAHGKILPMTPEKIKDEQLTMTFADYELEWLVDLLGIAQESAQEALNQTEAELEEAKDYLNIAKKLQERFIAIRGKEKNE